MTSSKPERFPLAFALFALLLGAGCGALHVLVETMEEPDPLLSALAVTAVTMLLGILRPARPWRWVLLCRHPCAAGDSGRQLCHPHRALHPRQHRRLHPGLSARMCRCLRRIDAAPQVLPDFLRRQSLAPAEDRERIRRLRARISEQRLDDQNFGVEARSGGDEPLAVRHLNCSLSSPGPVVPTLRAPAFPGRRCNAGPTEPPPDAAR